MTPPVKDPSRFVETQIEDETVVMLLESGDFFSLGGTAQEIWRLLDGERSSEAIAQALAANYQLTAAEIKTEVDDFVVKLGSVNLLK